jgi:hypothetical protein
MDRLLTALEVGSVHDATAVVAGIDVAAVALGWQDEGDASASGPSWARNTRWATGPTGLARKIFQGNKSGCKERLGQNRIVLLRKIENCFRIDS